MKVSLLYKEVHDDQYMSYKAIVGLRQFCQSNSNITPLVVLLLQKTNLDLLFISQGPFYYSMSEIINPQM